MNDNRFMSLALSLARRGLGNTWPNPAVGCVLVKEDRIVGRGWTRPGGRPHAEVAALAQAGSQASGATAYVTLEPCAHHGETPPCAEALVAAGVARVVVAMRDPDPRVNGRGLSILRAAGVQVVSDVLGDEAMLDQRGFLSRVSSGRPMVTLKLATSLDGRIATASGESRWISGPDARRMVHGQRMAHDAVLIGAGTARADDPSLTVRGLGAARQPVRVVVTRHLDIPLTGALARTAREVPVWLVHGDGVDANVLAKWEALGAKTVSVAAPGGQIDLKAALAALGRLGLTRVFCEGGGSLGASLLADGLVDEFVCFSAGLAIGAEGRPSIAAMGLERLEEAPRFDLIEFRQVGNDLMHRWVRRD